MQLAIAKLIVHNVEKINVYNELKNLVVHNYTIH